MMLRMGAVFLPLVFLLAFSFIPNGAHAATLDECRRISPNHRPATAADPVTRQPSTTINVGDCYNPGDAGVGMSASQAKEELKKMRRGALSQCAPATDDRNIDRLNDAFAICAAQFLKDYTTKYGADSILITSAFRDGAPGSAPDGRQSANQCAGGAAASNHSIGIAMDVAARPEGTYSRLWTHASGNPQFGVCFPFQNRPMRGYPNGDRPHMVLAATGGSESSLCAQQGVTQRCSGAPTGAIVPPNSTYRPPLTSGLDLFRGLTMMMPPPSYMMQPPLPMQPLTSGQGITGSFTPTQTQTQTGVSGSLTPTTNTNTNTNTNSNTLVSDLLNALAFGSTTSTNSTGTATSVPLIITGASAGSVAVINSDPNSGSFQSSTTGNLGSIGQPTTFTTNDLRWSPQRPTSFDGTTYSRLVSLYTTLRDVLLRMLNYLRPFGRPPQGEGSGDGSA